jgi:MFS family permease
MTRGGKAHPNWVLLTTILASGLAFIDGSVVYVGLPAIAGAFQAGASDLQWVVNGYLLPLGALLLLGGAAGDRFGRARLLIIGTALFGAASLACALAPSLAWLLAGRVVQGIGSALLMPNSLSILGVTFAGEARGRAIGIWASVGAAMAAVGPVLGGWLIDTVGWRTIFLINLPLAAGAIFLALIYVRDSRQENRPPSLDMLGGVLATAGLGALTWGLTIGSSPAGWTTRVVAALAAGIALMLAFLVIQKRKGEKAMMPLALFGSSIFVGLTLLTFLLYAALGALMVLLPYVLIKAAHYSGTQAGAALLPFAAVLALASPMMGALAGRIGSRLPLSIGPLVGGRRICADGLGGPAGQLLDRYPARHPGDGDRHGRRCGAADQCRAGRGRRGTYRLGLRSQQRRGAHRRHGGNGAAGRCAGPGRTGAGRRLSRRGARLCRRIGGGFGQRVLPDHRGENEAALNFAHSAKSNFFAGSDIFRVGACSKRCNSAPENA